MPLGGSGLLNLAPLIRGAYPCARRRFIFAVVAFVLAPATLVLRAFVLRVLILRVLVLMTFILSIFELSIRVFAAPSAFVFVVLRFEFKRLRLDEKLSGLRLALRRRRCGGVRVGRRWLCGRLRHRRGVAAAPPRSPAAASAARRRAARSVRRIAAASKPIRRSRSGRKDSGGASGPTCPGPRRPSRALQRGSFGPAVRTANTGPDIDRSDTTAMTGPAVPTGTVAPKDGMRSRTRDVTRSWTTSATRDGIHSSIALPIETIAAHRSAIAKTMRSAGSLYAKPLAGGGRCTRTAACGDSRRRWSRVSPSHSPSNSPPKNSPAPNSPAPNSASPKFAPSNSDPLKASNSKLPFKPCASNVFMVPSLTVGLRGCCAQLPPQLQLHGIRIFTVPVASPAASAGGWPAWCGRRCRDWSGPCRSRHGRRAGSSGSPAATSAPSSWRSPRC